MQEMHDGIIMLAVEITKQEYPEIWKDFVESYDPCVHVGDFGRKLRNITRARVSNAEIIDCLERNNVI